MTTKRDGAALLAAGVAGDRASLARALTLAADGSESEKRELWDAARQTGATPLIIGVTGPPGAGKSTFVDQLIAEFRGRDRRVAVLAIDPSSPWSTGALLGDRIRMQRHATDDDVFVRSIAARGHLGGLAVAVPLSADVIAAAGYDVVILETVGVGQSELEVAAMADVTVVLLAPGLGDSVQAAKAGLMEVADLFVVNKADQPGAGQLAAQLESALAVALTPVDSTVYRVNSLSGDGVADVVDVLAKGPTPTATARRRQLAAGQVQQHLLQALVAHIGDDPDLAAALARHVQAVADRTTSPAHAAAALLGDMGLAANPDEPHDDGQTQQDQQ